MVEKSASNTERIVALNATGDNDHGSEVLVDGAIAAMQKGVKVVLVGDPEELSGLLWERAYPSREATVDNCREQIEKHPYPLVHFVKGRSAMTAGELVAMGGADALAVGGRTERSMTAAMRTIKLAPNVAFPGIVAEAPRRSGIPQIVLDVGGNPNASRRAFVDRAFLGQAVAKALGLPKQDTALINMGKQKHKGTKAKRDTRADLEKCAGQNLLHFLGNAEGDDIFGLLGNGHDAHDAIDADVIVTDADEGNEMLKLVKKFAKLVEVILKEQVFTGVRGSISGALVASRLRKAFSSFRSDMQSSLVVGFNKTVVICHGASKAGAVEHALLRAARPHIDLTEASANIAAACDLLELPLVIDSKEDR